MTNIVSLEDKRREKEPHITGPVVCTGCKHEWVGVVPRECKTELECPKCSAMRGVWKHHFRLDKPSLICSASFKTVFGE